MSGTLKVSFAHDMPTASVEVVGPDLQVVDRLMLGAGQSQSVEVPSEASFLRVHLPSGKVVTLRDPGNLNREVSMKTVRSRAAGHSASESAATAFAADESSSLADLPESPSWWELQVHQRSSALSTSVPEGEGETIPLGSHGTAQLRSADGNHEKGMCTSRGREARWRVSGPPSQRPLTLRVETASGSALEVRIPGNAQIVTARADVLRGQSGVSFSVRVTTGSEAADAVAGYLARGDLYSAETMEQWCDEAADMLQSKMADPYAAAVGGYLLLRLGRFQKMRDWARNLAEWFEFLPDGCVIWACQLMQEPSSDPAEVRKYLLEAVKRGLPVYSGGLRLLTDALRLIGDEGIAAREEVLAAAGVVVWDAPLTATIYTTARYARAGDASDTVYDIAFASRA